MAFLEKKWKTNKKSMSQAEKSEKDQIKRLLHQGKSRYEKKEDEDNYLTLVGALYNETKN